MLIRHAHKAVCVDSTHGTNHHKFLLVTLLIIDEFGSGIPVAWFITSSENQGTLLEFFQALKKKDVCLFKLTKMKFHEIMLK